MTSPPLHVKAEPTAQNIVSHFPHNEYNQCPEQHDPPQRQQHKRHLVQDRVAVGGSRGIGVLDLVDCVIVPEGGPEAVQSVLSKCAVQAFVKPVSHDPPGHSDEPHDYEDDGDGVVDDPEAQLAEAAHSGGAELGLDPAHTLGKRYPHQEHEGNEYSADDEEPGQVGLGATVGIVLARLLSVDGSHNYHEQEDWEAQHVQDTDTANFTLLAVCQEAEALHTTTHIVIIISS